MQSDKPAKVFFTLHALTSVHINLCRKDQKTLSYPKKSPRQTTEDYNATAANFHFPKCSFCSLVNKQKQLFNGKK